MTVYVQRSQREYKTNIDLPLSLHLHIPKDLYRKRRKHAVGQEGEGGMLVCEEAIESSWCAFVDQLSKRVVIKIRPTPEDTVEERGN